MSIESAQAFYQRVTTDEAFRTQLQTAASEERTAIIREAGYDFTPEEWETATAEVRATLSRELDDAELEAVSGGVFPEQPVGFVMYGNILPPGLLWPS